MKRYVAGAILVALLATTACTEGSRHSSQSNSGTPPSTAEHNFGVAPTEDPSITYQPDVVFVGGGASAVMSQSNTGLSVVLRADAPRVSDLAPGKILFATGRIVGRVVGSKKVAGGGVEVFMTPVQLTDVVKDAKITTDTPVDLAASTVYHGQDFGTVPAAVTPPKDGAVMPKSGAVEESTTDSSGKPLDQPQPYEPASPTPSSETSSTRSYQLPPVAFVAAAVRGPSIPPVPTIPEEARAAIPAALAFPGNTTVTGGYAITPVARGGVGIRLAYDKGGTKINATLLLRLAAPSVHAEILITGGVIRYAALQLRGAAGLRMQFEAGSTLGLGGNTSSQIAVPLDFSIPLGGPLPLSLNWRQQFILTTAFSARNSTLSANADYTFGGGIGFTYRPGAFKVEIPGKITATTDIVDNINGVSVGVNGLVLAYQAKMILGIGAFGFASGLELGFNTSWGITQGSSIGAVICRQATLNMNGTVGIGWAIPRVLAAVINVILSIFSTSIPSSGGVRSAPVTIAQRSDWSPALHGCALTRT